MNSEFSILRLIPVLLGFFVMGFCDIVGISSDYARKAFGWSNTMTGFIPSMVFVWFLFLSIPVGVKMNSWGRKNTVLISMLVTVVGMMIPLVSYNSTTCMMAYALLGIGNAIIQVSLNPLLGNVITDNKLLTSSLTAGQVVKAISSFVGPFIMIAAVRIFGNGDMMSWYYCFPLLGGITLVSAIWLIATPIEREDSVSTGNTSPYADTFELLSDKRTLLLFFGIFFVVGVDVATNFISSKIMIDRFGWSNEEASKAPQVYFICRTIGAFIGAFVMTRVAGIKYFKVNVVTCVLVLTALVFIDNSWLFNLACIGGVGFLCSCIFPIIYSMAVQARPEKQNLISGLMITAVAGGGAVTPAIGVATDAVGIVGGILVILVCVAYLVFCAFCINKEIVRKQVIMG